MKNNRTKSEEDSMKIIVSAAIGMIAILAAISIWELIEFIIRLFV